MERQIERALRPGEFVHDRASFASVSGWQMCEQPDRSQAFTHPSEDCTPSLRKIVIIGHQFVNAD